MKKLHCAFTLLLSVILAGCGTDYRVHSVINTKKDYATVWEENHFGHYLNPKNLVDPSSYYIYINPYTYNPAALTDYKTKKLGKNLSGSFYQLAIHGSDNERRKYYRNELQNALLATIKESTEQHLSELKATENNVNLILGGATIGLAAGASVAAASSAKILAAAATGTAGARSLVNEQVYRNTFIEAVVALIEKDQGDFLVQVRLLQTNNINDYTVESAILDAKEFEAHGSFYHGLALLQKAVQNQIIGLTNAVPINQYSQSPQIISALPLQVMFKAPTTNNPVSTNSIIISGTGLRFLDVTKITSSDTNLARAINPFVNGDNQLNLTFTTKSAVTNASLFVGIPYAVQGGTSTLQLPVDIHVAQ